MAAISGSTAVFDATSGSTAVFDTTQQSPEDPTISTKTEKGVLGWSMLLAVVVVVFGLL